MKPITISLNPTYFCNLRCDFCYLTHEQLGDKQKIAPSDLDKLLAEVTSHTSIDYVDLYGGEVGLLPDDYYRELISVVRTYYQDEINIITNLTMPGDKLMLDENFWLTVSFDFDARDMAERVFDNMLRSSVPLSVLILASPMVLIMDVEMMISTLNMCSAIQSVEIKPYSKNQSNAHNVTDDRFENFVKKWLTASTPMRFEFINEAKIRSSLKGEYNAFSDDHVYITPAGKFGVLDFDRFDREKFTELDTFEDYIKWTEREKQELSPICKGCEYYGKCLTEHYRYVESLENSCNGYKFLLDWYKENGKLED